MSASGYYAWLHRKPSERSKRNADNLLQRDFTADAANKVWVTDVTAVWTLVGWVYLAAIVDLFSRPVVGWAMSDSHDAALALAALDRASAAQAATRPHPPLGPWQPLRLRRLHRAARRSWHHPKHEPQGRSLGQRRR